VCALLEQGELVGRRRGHVGACPVTAALHAAGRRTHPLGLAGRIHHVIRTALLPVVTDCETSDRECDVWRRAQAKIQTLENTYGNG